MDILTPDEEKSLTSDLHNKKARGYGAAVVNSGLSCIRSPTLTITHIVSDSDSLQSLAIKYDSQVADIKRLNGLWNNESLVLRDSVKIPVYSDINRAADATGHAVLPSTSAALIAGDSANASSSDKTKKAVDHRGQTQQADNGLSASNSFFAKFDSSLTTLRKKVAQQVEHSSSLLEEDDLLFATPSTHSNMGSDTSSIASMSSKRKSRASTSSLTSLSKLSSNEDIRSTPDHTVVDTKHKKKLHKYEQRQDEELFQL